MPDPLKRESVVEAMAATLELPDDEIGFDKVGMIRDALAAADRAGFVLVPKEATVAMVVAGQDAHDGCIDSSFGSTDGRRYDAPFQIYAAMIAAHMREGK